MFIKRPKSWEIPENKASSEATFLNRRTLIKAAGFSGIGVAAGLSWPSGTMQAAENDPTADLYPATVNPAYADAGKPITPEDVNSKYNNFYEFGSHKRIFNEAQKLKTRPWSVTFDGLVDKEMTVDFDTLVRAMPLEDRVYRHRCVEAWSMVIPWSGFPLKALVDYAQPLSSAKYVRFETFNDSKMASGQRQIWYPWPYIEGLTMAEATNDLAFIATGAYGKPLAKQFGAPLRLHTPWKYGFKSIKSIVRVSFTEERPVSFWEEVNSKEYGFYANVNPKVPHKRWSQATEEVLGTGGERVPTQLYNGYGEQVANLYSDVPEEQLYF
uniref:protein-methionine-sulfoxide reductase catalytic subunit MsrP n=1 Tax=Pararhizobium sp. IMCC3301 TaxID=3067904 RepID=UPI002741997C|nr:protein-methionine-sulfoxide reductase catalytic subunit MsrP [Pararhizobium sp. IMCC3301]